MENRNHSEADFEKVLTITRNPPGIVRKKWDPGILDPGPFSGQIGKVETEWESSSKRLGKLEVRTKKKRSSPIFGLEIGKV